MGFSNTFYYVDHGSRLRKLRPYAIFKRMAFRDGSVIDTLVSRHFTYYAAAVKAGRMNKRRQEIMRQVRRGL